MIQQFEDTLPNESPDFTNDVNKEFELPLELKDFLEDLRQAIYKESAELVMLEPLSESMLQHTYNRGKLSILNILLDTQ